MKKNISIVLAIVIVCSLPSTAFAASSSVATSLDENSILCQAEDGFMFITTSDELCATIITNDTLHIVTVSIKYSIQSNEVYQWYIDDYPHPFHSSSAAFWDGVIAYAENHMGQAEVVSFSSEVSNSVERSIQPCSSAVADIYPQFVTCVGTSPFNRIMRYNTTIGGNAVHVYEDMTFDIRIAQTKSWSTAVFVSTLITSILGLFVTNTLVNALCTAFNLIVSAVAEVKAGKLNQYSCLALFSRYVNINDSTYPYNMTERGVTYYAYENATPNNTDRAQIDVGSNYTEYSPSETYYRDCSAQALDGYNAYLVLRG